MPNATGINTVVALKKEVTWDLIPSAASAQQLRRTTAEINLEKDTYESEEKVTDTQTVDFRHGVNRGPGSLNGQLSPGSYNLPIQSLLRQNFVAGATTGSIVTVTAAAGLPGTFTRSSGSYITDGFKVGDVVRWTGWVVATANNARNYRIVALTASVMTVGGSANEAVVSRAAGDSVTGTVVGKKAFMPLTGLTDDSYSLEKYFSDIIQSEVYSGLKFGSAQIRLPATGMAEIALACRARRLTRATSQYFTTPTAPSTTGLLAAVNGVLRAAGVDVAIVTGLELNIDGNVSDADPVVGSNLLPDIFRGRNRVRGQFTALFTDAVLRNLFVDETEAELFVYLTGTSAINAPFLSFYMGRIKVSGASKSDAELGIIQTFPFVALRNNAGGAGTAFDNTTISVQDSEI